MTAPDGQVGRGGEQDYPMRVLVVDQDSVMLEGLARALRDHFTLDVVTSKADALDLLRANEFDVLIAGEQLADGSGLDLLSQAERRHSSVLRVFAAELSRLKMLKGRLAPFRLFHALSYPIQPDRLASVLMLAEAADAADADTASVEIIELGESGEDIEETPPAAVEIHAQPVYGRGRSGPANRATQAPQATPRRSASAARGYAAPRTPSSPRASVSARGPVPARMPESRQPPVHATPRAARSPGSMSDMRSPTPRVMHAGEPPHSQAFSAVSADPDESWSRRVMTYTGVAAVAVVAVVWGAMELFSADDAPEVPPPVPRAAAPEMPAEAADLIVEIEAALTTDNFAAARAATQRLREIAPSHPRLSFLESMAQRGPRSAARQNAGVTATPGPGTADELPVASFEPNAGAFDEPPAVERPNAEQPTSPMSDAAAATAASGSEVDPALQAATFSGRTLEADTVSPGSNPSPADSIGAGAAAHLPQSASSPSAAPAAPKRTVRRPSNEPPPVIVPPKVVRQTAPEYPPSAQRSGIEGFVELDLLIASNGKVKDIQVVSATPPDTFERAAINAVRRWKYDPQFVDGIPVDARAQVRLEFRLH